MQETCFHSEMGLDELLQLKSFLRDPFKGATRPDMAPLLSGEGEAQRVTLAGFLVIMEASPALPPRLCTHRDQCRLAPDVLA